MIKVNMHEAKSNLSKLVEQALQGEEVILAKRGTPLVKLVPVVTSKERPLGLHAQPLSDQEAQAALDPLPEDELGLMSEAFV
jgi:prevent-host-death family protein